MHKVGEGEDGGNENGGGEAGEEKTGGDEVNGTEMRYKYGITENGNIIISRKV